MTFLTQKSDPKNGQEVVLIEIKNPYIVVSIYGSIQYGRGYRDRTYDPLLVSYGKKIATTLINKGKEETSAIGAFQLVPK